MLSSPALRAQSPPRSRFPFTSGCRGRSSRASCMLFLLYIVGCEQGATAIVGGQYVHEWVHDSRHLLGFPCH